MLPISNQPPVVTQGPPAPPAQSSKTNIAGHAKAPNDLSQHPLHHSMQAQILNFLQSMKPPPGLSAMRDQVPDSVWNNKAGVATMELAEMLGTPIGTEMSQALKMKFGGAMYNDLTWGMAGLASLLTAGEQNTDTHDIAGFDWKGGDNTPSNTFDRLKEHLVNSGRTNPEMTGAVAYTLLWKSAPEFLLRNIPADADKNTLEWARVTDKVGALVENHPLQTLGMTYDDILDLISPSRVQEREQYI